ncbi:MAG: hypothetical protein AB8B85_06850, partial [Paracoccaceae bacterium]
DRAPPVSMRAWVADLDGEVIGMAGHYMHGEFVMVFSTMTEKMREFPITIMRASRDFMASFRRTGLPAICVASPDEENSCAFLERLGWSHIGTGDLGEVYRWQTSV